MVSDMNIFVWKLSKIAAQKKGFFFTVFFTFEVLLNGLFAPTSQSRMSNIFRDSESLGKSNGKRWSNIWTFLFGSGLKSPRNFFADFALQNMVETTLPDWLSGFGVFLDHPPMASVLLSASVERCFVSRMRDFSTHHGIYCLFNSVNREQSVKYSRLWLNNFGRQSNQKLRKIITNLKELLITMVLLKQPQALQQTVKKI